MNTYGPVHVCRVLDHIVIAVTLYHIVAAMNLYTTVGFDTIVACYSHGCPPDAIVRDVA
jgi:hypothetical protein